MKKSTVILMISAICVGAGLVFATIGISFGAKSQITLGPDGIQVGGTTITDGIQQWKNPQASSPAGTLSTPRGEEHDSPSDLNENRGNLTVEAFQNAVIHTVSANVEFIESNEFRVEYRTSQNEPLEKCEVSDGTLEIKLGGRLGINLNFFGGYEEHYVRVYYPAQTVFRSIHVSTTSGNVEAEKMIMDEGNFSTVSGDIDLEDCGIKGVRAGTTSGDVSIDGLQADSLEISTVSGKVEGEDVSLKGANIHTTSGNCGIFGNLKGNYQLSSTSGNIDVKANSPEGNWNYALRSVSGGKTVNGERNVTSGGEASAPNHVEASTTSGNIELQFGD